MLQHADREFADPRGAQTLNDAGEGARTFAWLRAAFWAALAGILTTVAVRYSLKVGRLSAPPDWDDVMYMRYAAERVNDLYLHGVRACAEGWIRNTPHSPVSCAMAFGSFLLFGMVEWAPYAMCALIVLGVLLVVEWVGGRQRRAVKVLMGLYICTIPALTYAVTDFKPDLMWGFSLSAVAAVSLLRPVVGAGTRHLVMLGALCAFTLLTKPTTTPGTLALLGLCGVAGTAKDWLLVRRRPTVVAMARSWGYVLGTTVVLAGPFFYWHWGYFRFYIQKTLFGEYRETWHIPGGWPAQFNYFVAGPGGTANLGGHLYVFLAIWLAGWMVAARRRDRVALVQAVGLTVMTIACYLLPTLNPAKNTLLASPFFAMAILTTAYWMGYMARAELRLSGSNRLTLVALAGMVAAGSFLYRWPSMQYGPDPDSRADAGRLHREVYEALLRQLKPYPQLITVTATGPVREITLAWYATRDRQPMTFVRPYSAKASDYEPYFDRSDFVLAQEDHVAGSVAIMPNEQGDVQSQVLDLMRHRDDYRPLSEFTAADGKKLILFQRTRWARGVMTGVRAVEGFGRIQGPYPNADRPMPMFCWGAGGGGRLILVPQRAGPATLRVECRASDRVTSLRVMSGSNVLATHRFSRPWTPEVFDVSVPLATPGAEIRFEYVDENHQSGIPKNAVIFTKVELISTGGN